MFFKLGSQCITTTHIVAVDLEATTLSGKPAISIWLSGQLEPWLFERQTDGVAEFLGWVDVNINHTFAHSLVCHIQGGTK